MGCSAVRRLPCCVAALQESKLLLQSIKNKIGPSIKGFVNLPSPPLRKNLVNTRIPAAAPLLLGLPASPVGEVRRSRCMFCGDTVVMQSEDDAHRHMAECPALQEQLNSTEKFTIPKVLR